MFRDIFDVKCPLSGAKREFFFFSEQMNMVCFMQRQTVTKYIYLSIVLKYTF